MSNLQEEGAGTGRAWPGGLGEGECGHLQLQQGRQGAGRQRYLGAWLMSGCGRY